MVHVKTFGQYGLSWNRRKVLVCAGNYRYDGGACASARHDPTIRSNDLLTIATERTFEIFTMEEVGATTFGVSVPKGGGCW